MLDLCHAQSTVADLISNDPELSIFATALANMEASEALSDILSSSTMLTVLAPTNDAFDALDNDDIADRVFGNVEFAAHLENLLTYHLTSDNMFLTKSSVVMANGETVSINGMTLSGLYNDATITTAGITATNGVIHKLDSVLLPGYWQRNVVELARSNTFDSLNTLTSFFDVLENLTFGGIIISTAQTSLVTMFAPTDEAFEELGPGAVEYARENTSFLLSVLQNHVVVGTVYPFRSLEDGDTVTALRGTHEIEVVEVLGEGESVLVADSLLLETDILVRSSVSNHAIPSHLYF